MFEELLKKLARALDLAAVPYMVFGGQAVLLYGEPRLTRDIDITLDTPPDRCGDVLAMVAQLGLHVLVEDAEKFVRETLVLPAMDVPSGIRIDFVFTLSEYERGAIAVRGPCSWMTWRSASRRSTISSYRRSSPDGRGIWTT